MTKIVGIIPSRYASTRFPAKPLVDIAGKSMIQRVYEQALKAESLSDVIIATDDERIFSHVEAFGGKAMMTSKMHQSGTDRCAEIANSLADVDVIINIQGDEPFIAPEQIDQLAGCFESTETQIATLSKKLTDPMEIENPSVVKVKKNNSNYAEDFGRKPFTNQQQHFKHIGIYGYRLVVLMAISKLDQSPRELSEKLEQLRWLDNGYSIQLTETEHETISIDTPEDLESVLRLKNI